MLLRLDMLFSADSFTEAGSNEFDAQHVTLLAAGRSESRCRQAFMLIHKVVQASGTSASAPGL